MLQTQDVEEKFRAWETLTAETMDRMEELCEEKKKAQVELTVVRDIVHEITDWIQRCGKTLLSKGVDVAGEVAVQRRSLDYWLASLAQKEKLMEELRQRAGFVRQAELLSPEMEDQIKVSIYPANVFLLLSALIGRRCALQELDVRWSALTQEMASMNSTMTEIEAVHAKIAKFRVDFHGEMEKCHGWLSEQRNVVAVALGSYGSEVSTHYWVHEVL